MTKRAFDTPPTVAGPAYADVLRHPYAHVLKHNTVIGSTLRSA